MNTTERVEMVMDAQEKLREAIDLIRQATSGEEMGERVRRTIIANLEMIVDADHVWLGRQANLSDLIDEINEEKDEF